MINNYHELIKRIHDDKPLSVIRFGNVEMTSILSTGIYPQMFTNAGFYGGKDAYIKWKNEYVKAVYNCDLVLDIYSCPSFQIQAKLFNRLDIWKPTLPYIENPIWWLKNIINEYNGKIGIVSFFKNDIEKQIKKLDKIFPDIKIKNKFIVVKSFNTVIGNEPHKDWVETFTKLKKKVDAEISLDNSPGLWLLSCGCYGLPLNNHISQTKKLKSIYVGGLLQTLFGIKGKRFDEREEYKRHYNKHWIYSNEKPKNCGQIENGCYWE